MICSNSKIIKSKKSKKKSILENNMNNFGIIKIDLNDIENYFPQESNQSLHNYTIDEAIKYDKRNILRVAYIYLLSRQIIFKTLFHRNPLELTSLRIILFIFMFSCDLSLNALFISMIIFRKNIIMLKISCLLLLIILLLLYIQPYYLIFISHY